MRRPRRSLPKGNNMGTFQTLTQHLTLDGPFFIISGLDTRAMGRFGCFMGRLGARCSIRLGAYVKQITISLNAKKSGIQKVKKSDKPTEATLSIEITEIYPP